MTIVIPTFNRENLVGNAISSCLGQNIHVEIIVVDDGSTDRTRERILDEYGDNLESPAHPGVMRYVEQENRGVSAARNAGLVIARGRYIKFLDSDDVLVDGALAREVEFAEEQEADVVVTGWRNDYYSDQGLKNLVRSDTVPAPRMERGVDDMLLGRAPWTAAALYRRERIKEVRWDVNFNKAEEWLWVWRVFFSGSSQESVHGETHE